MKDWMIFGEDEPVAKDQNWILTSGQEKEWYGRLHLLRVMRGPQAGAPQPD